MLNTSQWTGIAIGLLVATHAVAAPPPQEIRIATVAPLSGSVAHMGQDIEYGARLAIDELNAKQVRLAGQPVRWKLVSEDDAGDPHTAEMLARKLVGQKINGVVGHYNTGTSIPAAKVYFAAGIPQITPSAVGSALTHLGYNTAFRLVANDTKIGDVLGAYAIHQLGAKSVAIVDDRTAYGQSLAEQMARATRTNGGKVLAHEYGTDKTVDWKPILTRLKRLHPDVLMYAGLDATAAPLLQQMRTAGIKARFMTGNGACTSEMLKLSGTAMAGDVYCVRAGVLGPQMPGGAAFVKRFRAAYGVEVQAFAPYAYDAVLTLAAAMQAAGSADPARYRPYLARLKTQGVTGDIEFDPNGDLKRAPVTVLGHGNGAWKPLEVVRQDTAAQ